MRYFPLFAPLRQRLKLFSAVAYRRIISVQNSFPIAYLKPKSAIGIFLHRKNHLFHKVVSLSADIFKYLCRIYSTINENTAVFYHTSVFSVHLSIMYTKRLSFRISSIKTSPFTATKTVQKKTSIFNFYIKSVT